MSKKKYLTLVTIITALVSIGTGIVSHTVLAPFVNFVVLSTVIIYLLNNRYTEQLAERVETEEGSWVRIIVETLGCGAYFLGYLLSLMALNSNTLYTNGFGFFFLLSGSVFMLTLFKEA